MIKLGGQKGKLILAGFFVAFFVLIGGSILTSAVVHAQDTTNDAQTTDAGEKVCTSGPGLSGALAYFLCPFTEIIAKSTQFFEEYIIIPFMTVSPLTTNADNPVYILWQNFRDLANIGFILIMFISIFSVALSKHNAKRVLSRAFVVAIAINLSYFGVAFVIDAFNIFGAGISQLVMSALAQAKTTQLNSGTESGTVGSIFVLGGTALVAIVATGGAAIGWLFSFIMLAMLVVVVVVMILLLRQIAIIMLVILAPIAILMYMLPNTENYFQKWRKMLIQLLMMYPMIVMLFAAGKIFGVILQQPGLIKVGGDVSQQVAEAIRVMLQFIVYVIPLVALPATFAASGTLMSKAYGLASRRAIQPRSKRLGEDAKLGASEARARLANSNSKVLKPLSWAAGGKYRRDYTRESRRRNVQRVQEEYTAGQLGADNLAGSLMRRQAAGVGGQAGQTRAAAYAANALEKARQEDVQAESALLSAQLRRLGMNAKEFDKQFAEYLKGSNEKGGDGKITGTAKDSNGNLVQFDLNQNKNMVRAALNSAASQGEVGTIEAARMSTALGNEKDQSMVDSVIRANEGKMKEKGGYHLATNFNLANGRMTTQQTDPVTGETRNVPITSHDGMHSEMAKQRLIMAANSAPADIAGMKFGVLESMQKSFYQTDSKGNLVRDAAGKAILDSAKATASLNALDPALRAQLKTKLQGIQGNANLRGKNQNNEAVDDLEKIL